MADNFISSAYFANRFSQTKLSIYRPLLDCIVYNHCILPNGFRLESIIRKRSNIILWTENDEVEKNANESWHTLRILSTHHTSSSVL